MKNDSGQGLNFYDKNLHTTTRVIKIKIFRKMQVHNVRIIELLGIDALLKCNKLYDTTCISQV